MSVKLLAIYAPPDDREAFEHHYHNVHLPLVKRVPGLRRILVSHVTETLIGDATDTYMIAELHFDDEAGFAAAMASPENHAVGRDLMSFAKGKVQVLKAVEQGS